MVYDYQKRDTDDVKESAEANDSKWYGYIKAGIPIFKMSQDVHRLRFLYPTYEGRRKAIGFRVTTHANVGPDEKTYLCLRAMKDQPDPVDERLSQARKDGQGDDKRAKSMKPVDRLLTYVVDMDDTEAGVQLWPMADKANSALDRASIDSHGSVIEIEHPEKGRVVEVESKEKHSRGKEKFSWTECEFVVSERESWISEDEDQQKEWEDFIKDNPLDTVVIYETYDTLLEALGEVQHGRGSREDDQPRGRAARRGRSTGGERRTREAPQGDDSGPDADPGQPWADKEPDVQAPTQSRRRTRGQPAPQSSEPDLERDLSGVGLPETEEPERPARGRRRQPEPEDQQEAPARRRTRQPDPEPDPEQAPRRRRTRQPEVEQPSDEDLAPRRRDRPRPAQDQPHPDPPPARRRQRSAP